MIIFNPCMMHLGPGDIVDLNDLSSIAPQLPLSRQPASPRERRLIEGKLRGEIYTECIAQASHNMYIWIQTLQNQV